MHRYCVISRAYMLPASTLARFHGNFVHRFDDSLQRHDDGYYLTLRQLKLLKNEEFTTQVKIDNHEHYGLRLMKGSKPKYKPELRPPKAE